MSSVEPNKSTPIQLEYGANPPLHRRRIRRRAILLLVLISVGFAAWRYGPVAYRRAQLLYFQRQCLNFQQPPDFVAFESDPDAAARLIKQGTHSPFGAIGTVQADGTIAWLRQPSAGFYPKCLIDFTEHGDGDDAVDGAFVYLHERTSAAGKRYLVGVYLEVGNEISIEHFVLTPATTSTNVVHHLQTSSFLGTETWKGAATARNVRFFAGQSDPNDPSRFSIDFEVAGRRDTLDGRVDDDGGIMLQLRSLGLAPP